jgi:hypothetical protein
LTKQDLTIFKQFLPDPQIHQFMTGRIKLVDANGEPLVTEDTPEIEYSYDEVDDFDKQCGTFNTSDYQLPHPECPEKFVCDVAGESSGLSDFADCMDAMNCAMMVGMTTHATSEVGLFIHQMIPHHQNAVNMAKALLKTGLPCDDLLDDEDTNCIMQGLMREIVNGQNAQIQSMRAVLETLEEPAYADCVVPVFGEDDVAGITMSDLNGDKNTSGAASSFFARLGFAAGLASALLLAL